MVRTSLPPGFRFHPTDVELVKYYLKRKITGKKLHFEAISEVDIYKYAPSDLPDKSCLQSGDLKWYFFCPREKKYASGSRMNRATEFGYWKTTGKDRPVHYNDEVVGMIKTLIYHTGRPPRGDRTNWVMHEYRLEEKGLVDIGVVQDSYVLSMIFQKDGPGPRNGAQYGAPFKEDDWISDAEDNCVEAGSSANHSVLLMPSSHNNYAANSTHASGSKLMGSSSESCISHCVPPTSEGLHSVSAIDAMLERFPGHNDDILSMLDCFSEEDICKGNGNDRNEDPNNLDNVRDVGKTSIFDGHDIFKDLGDLGNLAGLSEDGCGFPGQHKTMKTLEQMHPGDNFLELMDLEIPLNCSSEAGEYGCAQFHGLGTGYNTSNNTDQFYYQTSPCSAVGQAPPSQSTLLLEKEFEDQLYYLVSADAAAPSPPVINKCD